MYFRRTFTLVTSFNVLLEGWPNAARARQWCGLCKLLVKNGRRVVYMHTLLTAKGVVRSSSKGRIVRNNGSYVL